MHIERHGWQSPRLGKWMGINVYGHYGSPILVFPTMEVRSVGSGHP